MSLNSLQQTAIFTIVNYTTPSISLIVFSSALSYNFYKNHRKVWQFERKCLVAAYSLAILHSLVCIAYAYEFQQSITSGVAVYILPAVYISFELPFIPTLLNAIHRYEKLVLSSNSRTTRGDIIRYSYAFVIGGYILYQLWRVVLQCDSLLYQRPACKDLVFGILLHLNYQYEMALVFSLVFPIIEFTLGFISLRKALNGFAEISNGVQGARLTAQNYSKQISVWLSAMMAGIVIVITIGLYYAIIQNDGKYLGEYYSSQVLAQYYQLAHILVSFQFNNLLKSMKIGVQDPNVVDFGGNSTTISKRTDLDESVDEEEQK